MSPSVMKDFGHKEFRIPTYDLSILYDFPLNTLLPNYQLKKVIYHPISIFLWLLHFHQYSGFNESNRDPLTSLTRDETSRPGRGRDWTWTPEDETDFPGCGWGTGGCKGGGPSPGVGVLDTQGSWKRGRLRSVPPLPGTPESLHLSLLVVSIQPVEESTTMVEPVGTERV